MVSIFLASVTITLFISHAYLFKDVCTFPVKLFGAEPGAIFLASFISGLSLGLSNSEYDAKEMMGIVALSVFFTYLIIFFILALPVLVFHLEVSWDFWYGNIGKIFLTFPILAFGEFSAVFLYHLLIGE